MLRHALCGFAVLLSMALVGFWLFVGTGPEVSLRVPISANQSDQGLGPSKENVNQGTLISGTGHPGKDIGSWPQFRGILRNAIASGIPIASSWPEGGPKVLWKIQVGEGHAGAALHKGCVYLLDYDEKKKEDVIRCLSLENGEEIWRYTYFVKVKRNHGMSRTVPAVDDDYVVTLGPKCHVHCLNSKSGELVWKKDLVAEYGATIPEWYAGQCPLMDGGRIVLAPGGTCLMTSIDLATGKPVWQTSNEDKWQMSHSSILAASFEGKNQYVWCSAGGALGIAADTGEILWKLPEWKIRIATIPSPIDLLNGRIFFCGGYNAGSAAIQLVRKEGRVTVETLFRREAKTFGSDQQTPVFFDGLIYGVIPGGKLACLTPEGVRLWVEEAYNFGLGPYMVIDGKLLILDDDQTKPGELCLFKIDAKGATKLAGHKVIESHDAWAPFAFADGKVVLRDSTTMLCLDLREP
jgi:outer membrane protein assembly factor BamB